MELKGLALKCISVLESRILGLEFVHWGPIPSQLLLPSLITSHPQETGAPAVPEHLSSPKTQGKQIQTEEFMT